MKEEVPERSLALTLRWDDRSISCNNGRAAHSLSLVALRR
jgi:hypothetical protein